jgi:hypothetical protein
MEHSAEIHGEDGEVLEEPRTTRTIPAPAPEISTSADEAPVGVAYGPATYGGGDLNGTAATVILHGQAGTDASQLQMPRQSSGNYTGII